MGGENPRGLGAHAHSAQTEPWPLHYHVSPESTRGINSLCWCTTRSHVLIRTNFAFTSCMQGCVNVVYGACMFQALTCLHKDHMEVKGVKPKLVKYAASSVSACMPVNTNMHGYAAYTELWEPQKCSWQRAKFRNKCLPIHVFVNINYFSKYSLTLVLMWSLLDLWPPGITDAAGKLPQLQIT